MPTQEKWSASQWCVEIARLELLVCELRGQAELDGTVWASAFLNDVLDDLALMGDRAEQVAAIEGEGFRYGDFLGGSGAGPRGATNNGATKETKNHGKSIQGH